MKRLIQKLSQAFSPSHMQDLDLNDLSAAIGDVVVRRQWLSHITEELQKLNLSLNDATKNQFQDIAMRRKALTWALQEILDIQTSVAVDRQQNLGHEVSDPFEGVEVKPSPY